MPSGVVRLRLSLSEVRQLQAFVTSKVARIVGLNRVRDVMIGRCEHHQASVNTNGIRNIATTSAATAVV